MADAPPAPPPSARHLADGELLAVADAALDERGQAQLVAALRQLGAVHDWWAEGLALDESDEGVPIRLRANVTLVGYETADGDLVDVDEADDAFMAFMDLCVAVDWLAARSDELGVGWRLTFAGEAAGHIQGGREDDSLEAFLVALGERVGADFDDGDDVRAAALDEAHADRLSGR